jgi:hypothetical protein
MGLAFFEIEDQHAKLHVRGVERDKFTRVQKRGGEITGIPSDRANLLELIAASTPRSSTTKPSSMVPIPASAV